MWPAVAFCKQIFAFKSCDAIIDFSIHMHIWCRWPENMGETGIKPIVIEEIGDSARKYNVQKVI